MEYTKIKNIIIVILLALNMFFLVLFLIGRWESGKLEQQAKKDIISLFSSEGITVEETAIPADSTIGYYKTTRDLESEKLIAETLLGTREMTAAGGNIYKYANILGEAVFYPQGEFSVSLTSGKAFSDTSNSSILKFLKDMKIDAEVDRVLPDVSGEGKTLYLNCVYNKTKILNARLAMVFDGERLISLSGKRLVSLPVYADAKIMSIKTALISFLKGIKSLDPDCNKLSSVSAAYFLLDDGTGGAALIPIWKVDTSTGNYYVNGLNGKISELFD